MCTRRTQSPFVRQRIPVSRLLRPPQRSRSSANPHRLASSHQEFGPTRCPSASNAVFCEAGALGRHRSGPAGGGLISPNWIGGPEWSHNPPINPPCRIGKRCSAWSFGAFEPDQKERPENAGSASQSPHLITESSTLNPISADGMPCDRWLFGVSQGGGERPSVHVFPPKNYQI